ncbi:MAG: hypothetical protein KAJ36_06180, partial [Candidatus Thorarchaeota archaeon]|nr:hypothetical protein [Candidatus Thorarchaeota archaeon]
ERDQSDPMIEIMKRVSTMEDELDTSKITDEDPEGVSLADFTKVEKHDNEEQLREEDKSVLLAALLGAQKSSKPEPVIADDASSQEYDPTIPASSRFILVLQKLSERIGKEVSLEMIQTESEKAGLTEDEFNKALAELEEQGIIYRSGEDTVSYVDFEM